MCVIIVCYKFTIQLLVINWDMTLYFIGHNFFSGLVSGLIKSLASIIGKPIHVDVMNKRCIVPQMSSLLYI